MNRFFLKIFFVFSTLVLFTGCEGEDGEDGEDGRAAIAYSWSGDLYSYTTDDPIIPSTIYNGTYYYYATPGTYYYAYCSYWDCWDGYYSIYINEGEEGESGDIFWEDGEDGEDGEDMCFELMMYSTIGASFYEWYCDYEGVYLPRTSENHTTPSLSRYLHDMEDERSNYEEGHNIVSSEFIEESDFDFSNKNDRIIEIDNNPNSITESGGIGKYKFIHRYIKK